STAKVTAHRRPLPRSSDTDLGGTRRHLAALRADRSTLGWRFLGRRVLGCAFHVSRRVHFRDFSCYTLAIRLIEPTHSIKVQYDQRIFTTAVNRIIEPGKHSYSGMVRY